MSDNNISAFLPKVIGSKLRGIAKLGQTHYRVSMGLPPSGSEKESWKLEMYSEFSQGYFGGLVDLERYSIYPKNNIQQVLFGCFQQCSGYRISYCFTPQTGIANIRLEDEGKRNNFYNSLDCRSDPKEGDTLLIRCEDTIGRHIWIELDSFKLEQISVHKRLLDTEELCIQLYKCMQLELEQHKATVTNQINQMIESKLTTAIAKYGEQLQAHEITLVKLNEKIGQKIVTQK